MNDEVAGITDSRWLDRKSPEVSIIILNYNKPDLTIKCVEHILLNTVDRRFEIIVVDNGSAVENYQPLVFLKTHVNLIRLELNRYFGEGNNIGVDAARGKYIVFLNNDAFVTANWLDPMVRRMEDQTLLGGIGPLFLYPDGRIQEAGGFIGRDGVALQVGKYQLYSKEDVDCDHVVDYCSAACFLMRKDLFIEIGGFEYIYEPAYYEDVDLCLKIAKSGRFVAYCAESKVVHIENATSASHRVHLGLENIIDVNRSQLLKSWGSDLEARDHAALTAEPRYPAPPLFSKRRSNVAFYTPYSLSPGGGERYLLTAAAALVPDHNVVLATEDAYSTVRLRALGRDLKINLSGISLIERRNVGQLDGIELAIIMGNEAIPQLAGIAPTNLYICQFPFPLDRVSAMRRTGNLSNFVGTIVYSEFVRGYLRTALGAHGIHGHPIDIIAPPVPLAPPGISPSPLAPPYRILLIGRFFVGGHNKRHDIAIEVVKRLIQSGLPVELDLIGGLPPDGRHRDHFVQLTNLAQGFPIRFHANASPDKVAELLQRGHLYVHCAGYGVDAVHSPHECEHFGISVLEAMSFGLVPFVVDNGGPAEFVRDGISGYTYHDVEELAAKISAVLVQTSHLEAIRASAVEVARQFGENAFQASWRAKANSLLEKSSSTY